VSKTFVLIHGTWHGGWAWKYVVRHLSQKEHIAHTPTLAGHGPGAVRRGITHQHCVDSVVAYIRYCNLRNVVLVGHSFGGTVVQKVAEKLPDRIAGIVFLDALVLNDNERVFDILPDIFLESLIPKSGNATAITDSENAEGLLPPPPWETWCDHFIQDALEFVARSTWEQLSPEPAQVNLDTLDLKCFYSLAIPKPTPNTQETPDHADHLPCPLVCTGMGTESSAVRCPSSHSVQRKNAYPQTYFHA